MEKSVPRFDARAAISYLIAAGGNSKLAADRAARDFTSPFPINEAFLLTTVASDPTSIEILGNQVRVLALLTTLDAFRNTHLMYMDRLSSLSAKDTANAYTKLLEAISSLIAPTSSSSASSSSYASPSSSPIDAILSALPDEARNAVQYFLQKPTQDPQDPQDPADQSSSDAHSALSQRASQSSMFGGPEDYSATASAERGGKPPPPRDKPAGSSELASELGGEGDEEDEDSPVLLHEFRSYSPHG